MELKLTYVWLKFEFGRAQTRCAQSRYTGLKIALQKALKILKNDKVKNFWSKNVICWNRFRLFLNVFYPKNLEIEIFSRVFSWDCHLLTRMTKIVNKWPSQKFLDENILLVGIDSECFKTYFKPKISKLKFFSRVIFFLGLSFSGQNMENDSQKFLFEISSVGIDSECSKHIRKKLDPRHPGYLKMRNSN